MPFDALVRRWGTALNPRALALTGTCLVSLYLLAFRVHDLSESYAMLGEQVRDWGIAQRNFTDLPLIGPRSANSGLDIGPIYYWLLWAGRKLLVPVIGALPHTGGWTVAAFQTLADGVLIAALTRAIGSWWLAASAVVLVATTTLDASLSAVVWNPPLAEAFVKVATATLLWPGAPSIGRSILVLALAIGAVQCHSTAIFVAMPIVACTLYRLLCTRGIAAVVASAAFGAVLIVLWVSLYALQPSAPTAPSGSGNVLTSILDVIAAPTDRLRPLVSADAVAHALEFAYLDPFSGAWPRWVLLAGALLTLVAVRQLDLVAVGVAPPLVAIAVFSVWQGQLAEVYWFLVILPATAICLVAPLALLKGTARPLGIAAFVCLVIALQPVRAHTTWTVYRQPAYGPLARGVTAAAHGPAIRDIKPAFKVPVGMDPLFMFSLLGGSLNHSADAVLVIGGDGSIRYEKGRVPAP